MPLAAHAFGSSKKDCMHQRRVTVLGVWHLVELTGDGLDGFSTRLSLLLSYVCIVFAHCYGEMVPLRWRLLRFVSLAPFLLPMAERPFKPAQASPVEPEVTVGAHGLSRWTLADRNNSWHSLQRVYLRNSVSGARVCLPGVGTRERGWDSVPSHFAVRELLGVLVFLVDEDDSVNSQGEQCRVVAVLSSTQGLPAPPSYSLFECASDDGVVRVVFGEHVLEFTGFPVVERPLMDLEGVSTPPTPDQLSP